MAFPAGMQTVHVTAGPILHPDGSPVTRGTIRLRPEWELIHDPSGVRVIRTSAAITLGSGGTGVTDVPASDSTGLRRPGVRYWVTYELGYGVHAREPHWVYLPAASPNADLESLLPVEGPAGPVYVPGVVSVAGLTGVVTAQQLAAAGVGGGSAGSGFEHLQATPSASWSIPHLLGRRPSTALYVDGVQVDADVEATATAVTVVFPTPTSGTAVLT